MVTVLVTIPEALLLDGGRGDMTQAITAPESDRPFKVEQRGIDIVPESERHGSPLELFWIWAAGHSGRRRRLAWKIR